MKRKRTAILISGRGSNMSALIAAGRESAYPAEFVVVISNRPGAAGLHAAEQAGIHAVALDHRLSTDREGFDHTLDQTLRDHDVELVACAGYMRIMTRGLITAWRDRMINIHPSLLPLYPGLHTHERALADGVKIHGCSVHVMRDDVDTGPIIAQAAVPVLSDDTPERLAVRVLAAEHQLYPRALSLYASGRVRIEGKRAIVEGDADQLPLLAPLMPYSSTSM
ncbi:phosphoribosylglycinamide formyltransferase [soil metagenome]